MNNFTSINYLGLDEVNQLLPTSDGSFIAVGQTTYPLSGGSNIFILKASAQNDFPNTAEYYTIDSFVGVDQSLKLESVTFHPNPCEDSFVLAFDGSPRYMKIYDNIGNLMLEREVYPGVLIDISLFNSGLYYIHINNEINKLIKL